MNEDKLIIDCSTNTSKSARQSSLQNTSIKHKLPVIPTSMWNKQFTKNAALVNKISDEIIVNVGPHRKADKAVQTDFNVHLNLNEMRLITILRAREIDPCIAITQIYEKIDRNNNGINQIKDNSTKVDFDTAFKTDYKSDKNGTENNKEIKSKYEENKLKRELLNTLGDLINDGTLTINKEKAGVPATPNEGEEPIAKRYKATCSNKKLQREVKVQSFKRAPQPLPCSTHYVHEEPLMAVNYLQSFYPPSDAHCYFNNQEMLVRDTPDHADRQFNYPQLHLNHYAESPFIAAQFHQQREGQYHPSPLDVARMAPYGYLRDYRHHRSPPTQKPLLYDPRFYMADQLEYPNV